jgi:hypothetical protein
VLSVPPSKITYVSGATDHTPYEWQTGASRTTYCAGNAIKLAAEDLKDKVLDLAQVKMGAMKRDLDFEDGYVVHKIYPERRLPISEFALGVKFDTVRLRRPRIGVGSFTPETTTIPTIRRALPAPSAAFWTMGVSARRSRCIPRPRDQGAQVVLLLDACKVINPLSSARRAKEPWCRRSARRS